MATVQITLTDTPEGGLSVHTTFKPAVGKACTAAQSAALEIVTRTSKQWGVQPGHEPYLTICRCQVGTPTQLQTTLCSACGKAVPA